MSVLPDTLSSTSTPGRTLSASAMFIWLPATVFCCRWRSNIIFRRARLSTVSTLGFSLKVTKSAYEILDLFDSGMKNDEWSSVEAAMSILTAPLSPEMRAVPEA